MNDETGMKNSPDSVCLTPVTIPDRARRLVIEPLAPNHVRILHVINRDGKLIAKRKSEALREHVIVSPRRTGELGLVRPRRTAITRTPLKNIPQGMSRIHPGNPHVARNPGSDRRERMLHLIGCRGHISLCRPACPAGC